MKRIVLFACAALLLGGPLAAQVKAGASAWVSAKSVVVKSSTGFFASKKGTLVYGDQVSVLQIKGNYAEVRSASNSSVSGWVSSATLSAKRVIAGSSAGASASEIALAGKGFNEEVENAYKAEGNLNYADVDKTEAITVSDEELLNFITSGHLTAGGEQ